MNSKLVISIALCVILLSSSLAYAEEGVDFFTWLWSLFGSQEPAVSVQGNEAQANGQCSQQCGQGCNLEKCVNQDGCIWNKGNCDNICTPGMAKEVVVIKRYESCSNAQNCNDVYLCENGVTGNPISVAFSSVPKLLDSTGIGSIGSNIDDSFIFDDSTYYSDLDTVDDVSSGSSTNKAVSCSNLPASFVAGYNQYSGTIKNAADNYLRSSGIDNPEALIAGIITKESAWNERAVNPKDPSYGLMQIAPRWHPECDVNKIRSFDVNENIRCGVAYMAENLRVCGNIKGALKAYNSGQCNGKTTGYYAENILGEISYDKPSYLDWKSCLSGQTSVASSTDNQYINQPCTSSPEGLAGTCQYATASGCTFDDTRSCGSTGTVKCCVPDSTFIGTRCEINGARGTCEYVGTSGCTFPYSGLCHGTTDVKCCFPATSPTGYVTASVTGMDTADATQIDLTSLDASLNQQSSVLQEGQYTVSEKISIQNNDEAFTYTDDQGTILNPQCNIDPINTGVRDYWIGLQTSSDVCIGMHSVAPPEHDCGNTVKSEEIKNIFQNIQIGTPVIVKDPYEAETTAESQIMPEDLLIGDENIPTIIIDSNTMGEDNPQSALETTNLQAPENINPVQFSKEELMGIEAPTSASLVSLNDLCPLNTNIVTGAATTMCDTIKMRPEVLAAFNRMKDAANADGITLFVLSGYRSFQTQKQIWNGKFAGLQGSDATRIAKIAEFSAVPGLSRHHWGTEIDMDSLNQADFMTNGKYANVYTWLKNNAANFGFCQPYDEDRVVKTEPWHWSYKPLSSQFTNQHMSTITASDISGQGISGAGAIASEFDYYHSGFISDVNSVCLV